MISPFRVDVLDANGDKKTAAGPITAISSLSFTEKVDAAGSVRFEVPAVDEIVALFTTGSRLHIYIDEVGDIGEFIYKRATYNTKTRRVAIEAWNLLKELAYVSTLTDREFDDSPSGVVAGELLLLAPTLWQSVIVDGDNTTITFQGVSVLSALGTLRKQTNLHYRLNRPHRSLEWGGLGAASGAYASNMPGQQQGDIWRHSQMVLIDDFGQSVEDDHVVNRVFATGGSAATPITMNLAGAVGIYTKKSLTGPGGDTLYYVEDTTSQASYNERERVLKFNNIQIVDTEWKAANAIKIAAEAYLLNHKDPTVVYTMSTRHLPIGVLPGEQISVRYRGYTQGFKWVDVDTDLYILEIQRNFTAKGDQSQVVKTASQLVPPDTDVLLVGDMKRDIDSIKYTG